MRVDPLWFVVLQRPHSYQVVAHITMGNVQRAKQLVKALGFGMAHSKTVKVYPTHIPELFERMGLGGRLLEAARALAVDNQRYKPGERVNMTRREALIDDLEAVYAAVCEQEGIFPPRHQ